MDLWVCVFYMKCRMVGYGFVKMTCPKESHFLSLFFFCFLGLESYSGHDGVCFLGFCLQKESYCVGTIKCLFDCEGKTWLW